MGTLITFTPRQPAAPVPLPSPSPAETRHLIEEAAQTALDTADRLLAILDSIGGDPDLEDGGDAEPSLGAPEGHDRQAPWFRGTTRDLELDRHPEHTQ